MEIIPWWLKRRKKKPEDATAVGEMIVIRWGRLLWKEDMIKKIYLVKQLLFLWHSKWYKSMTNTIIKVLNNQRSYSHPEPIVLSRYAKPLHVIAMSILTIQEEYTWTIYTGTKTYVLIISKRKKKWQHRWRMVLQSDLELWIVVIEWYDRGRGKLRNSRDFCQKPFWSQFWPKWSTYPYTFI